MPSTTNNDSSNAHPQAAALNSLLNYCTTQSITISPLIRPRLSPSAGLGIYAVRPIKKGQQLIHVPTKAMLTTRSIPDKFLSKAAKKEISVHCALAMYLAFGAGDRYAEWMATWPAWEEFVEGMVVFWGEDFRKKSDGAGWSERRSDLYQFSRSLGVDELWLTVPESQVFHGGDRKGSHLAQQSEKIRACIDAIDKHLPHIKIRDLASHDAYLRFLYMWACVNTRCFYYLRPGQAPPEDSNEAMALCPFQDLFNHNDGASCVGVFDHHGFFINADKDCREGEELHIKYGDHGNDMLWMEYGFMMDQNSDDTVKIDNVVLSMEELGEAEKLQVLEDAGYRGDYTLKNDGVCYRTIVASYFGILDDRQWKRLIAGGLDPDTNTRYALARLQAKQRITQWIMRVRHEAESNIAVLARDLKNEDDLVEVFVNDASLKVEQSSSRQVKLDLATRRRDVCMRRWSQIFDMCMAAMRQIEHECPGAFVPGTNGGIEIDAQNFLEGLRWNPR